MNRHRGIFMGGIGNKIYISQDIEIPDSYSGPCQVDETGGYFSNNFSGRMGLG